MEPGAALPPIRLSSAEAIACTLALQAWDHVDDDLLVTRALGKIRDAMPTRVRWTADAVARTVRIIEVDRAFAAAPSPVSADLLGRLATACRHGTRVAVGADALAFDPVAIAHTAGRWYLVAFAVGALDDDGWQLLRLDEIGAVVVTSAPATSRDAPTVGQGETGLEGWITAQVAARTQRVRITVVVHAAAEQVRPGIADAWGSVEPLADDRCLVRCGADSYDVVARWLLLLGHEITVVEPPELRTAFAGVSAVAARAARAHGRVPTAASGPVAAS